MLFWTEEDFQEEEEKNLLDSSEAFIPNLDDFNNKNLENKVEEEIIPEEKSVLQKDVKLIGDISCKSNLVIHGFVKGSVDCKYDLRIESKVEADLKAGSISLIGAEVNGAVDCRKEIMINNESVVNGNISCGECTVDGTVTGNIIVDNAIHIQKNAVIEGDITAREISLLQGARINGKINMGKKN